MQCVHVVLCPDSGEGQSFESLEDAVTSLLDFQDQSPARHRYCSYVFECSCEQGETIVDYGYVVTDLLNLSEEVRREEDCLTTLYDALHYVPNFNHADRVQTDARLVQNHQFRVAEEGLS